MNLRAMPTSFMQLKSIIASLTLALALPLAGCAAPDMPPPLEGAAIGGPFELINGAGETVRWSDFEGKYRIVYFGFANCPDICPTDMARTMQGFRQFTKSDPDAAAKVQPIFITVDPGRDTPEKVAEFADAFPGGLIGLTGTPAQVDQAVKNFAASAQLGDPDESGNYDVNHTRLTLLFGPAGEPIATLPTDLGADAIAAELAKWVR